jgi:trans-aconitate methyltransferase
MYYENLEIWILIGTLFIVMVGIAASIIQWSIRNQISPMPSSPKAKRTILAGIPEVSGTIYELGSGWGTLAFPVARRYPHCQVIGLETSPIPYRLSRLRLIFERLPNLKLKNADFFSYPLQDASLVVCYLYPEAMRRLKEKFLAELKPGTWVISNTFAIPGWSPHQVLKVDDMYFTKIYIYRMS